MTDAFARLTAALADRYRIERKLGEGGMATVYLARDRKHDRDVAIKVLDPELAGVIGPQRFLQEIQIAARLTHPNILPLHDSGDTDGLLYYVMPYVEGESLRQRLERERHLALDEAVGIVHDVAAALTHAHGQGVIHRDIKPENILLAGGQAIVADFGIARAIDAAGTERLTGTGLAIGTPAYMSPEQVGAERTLDGRADIYSLGCVVYEMLGGEPPFTGSSAQVVMARHTVDPPPSLRTLRPAVPRAVEAAVERALAKVPKDRFATAEEFATTLTRASTARPSAVGHGRARRERLRWAAGIAAGAVLVVAAIWRFATLGGAPTIRRFAVLPFEGSTPDSAQAYFVEGVHDAVISDLADEGLGVIARTSVLQYEHSDKPVRVIARELGVDALVETSLARTPDSVTLQARLVDGRSEQYLWHQTYAASLVQVPSLARSVARGIATAIAPSHVSRMQGARARGRSVDPQVYDDYLKGLSFLRRLNRADLETAREYFERAIARDSTYAPAWAGLSASWTNGRQLGFFTPQEATPPSEAAAYKAIALDSTLAEAHFALGAAKFYGEWNWQGGEREHRRGLELKPDAAPERVYYATILSVLHRPKEAVQQLRRAHELDPLDPEIDVISAVTYNQLGRHDDALALAREALARSPTNPRPAAKQVWVSLHLAGRFAEADSAMQRWAAVQGDSGLANAIFRGHRQGGYAGAMRAAVDYWAARAARTGRVGNAWGMAIWFVRAGDYDAAMTSLERAFTDHDAGMAYLDVAPGLKPLHGDPRFQALLKKMKLPS